MMQMTGSPGGWEERRGGVERRGGEKERRGREEKRGGDEMRGGWEGGRREKGRKGEDEEMNLTTRQDRLFRERKK